MFKALGARNGHLYRAILAQAVIVVLLGFGNSLAITILPSAILPRPGLSMVMVISRLSLFKVGGLSLVMPGCGHPNHSTNRRGGPRHGIPRQVKADDIYAILLTYLGLGIGLLKALNIFTRSHTLADLVRCWPSCLACGCSRTSSCLIGAGACKRQVELV